MHRERASEGLPASPHSAAAGRRPCAAASKRRRSSARRPGQGPEQRRDHEGQGGLGRLGALLSEAQKYMDLVAQEEAEARRPSPHSVECMVSCSPSMAGRRISRGRRRKGRESCASSFLKMAIEGGSDSRTE